ncbi:MAG TPA: TIGR01244 family sulfur transferase [Allosphingosinicella sp.]|nr:TIGR01244 family sulfur transferase [Allosphingosinicella sp.]
MFRALSDTVLVAARQLRLADVAAAAAEGVSVIVNNRPDGEEPGQPESADVERAAKAAGLRYHHIPVAGGIGPDQVAAMAAAMDEGKLLAFCRSGTRSTWLWALAAHGRGADGDTILASAAAAGYDLGPLRAYLG